MRNMRAYFDLSFEEWFLQKQQLIDAKFWRVWRVGIKTAMSKAAFKQAWEKIKSDSRFGPEFEHFIDNIAPGSDADDDAALKGHLFS